LHRKKRGEGERSRLSWESRLGQRIAFGGSFFLKCKKAGEKDGKGLLFLFLCARMKKVNDFLHIGEKI